MKIWLLILLLSFGEPIAQSQMCDIKPGFLCSSEMEPFLLSPPADEGSLFHLCGLFKEYFKCMWTFETKCGKSEGHMPYKYVLDARNFAAILCSDNSFFQQEYLTFAKCFKGAMPEIRSCQKKFGTHYDSYFMPYEGKDLETIEDICAKHKQNVGCISDEISMKCGKEAKQFFLKTVQYSKYLEVTCPKFNGENLVQSQMCKLNPGFFCGSEVDKLLQSPPTNRRSLFHLCRHLEEYFKCMRTFETGCDISEDYRMYKYILDARNFVHIICVDDSSFQKEYLSFAKCFKSAMPEIRFCQKKFRTKYDSYFLPYQGEDPHTIEEICAKHKQNVECISDEIFLKCGEQARYFFHKIVQYSKYLQVTCPKSNREAFVQSQLCELNPIFFCGSDMDQFLLSPPEDKDSLANLCRLFIRYFRCMRTIQTRCDISDDYRPYNFLLDAKYFADNLCLERGFLHKDYLRFAECYNTTMPEIRLCQNKFDTSYDSYFSPHEVSDPDMIEDICEKHKQNVECISDAINLKCGGEAKLVFRRIVQLSKYLQVTCPKFYLDD